MSATSKQDEGATSGGHQNEADQFGQNEASRRHVDAILSSRQGPGRGGVSVYMCRAILSAPPGQLCHMRFCDLGGSPSPWRGLILFDPHSFCQEVSGPVSKEWPSYLLPWFHTGNVSGINLKMKGQISSWLSGLYRDVGT